MHVCLYTLMLLQLKNMVYALLLSTTVGPKQFQDTDKCVFRWIAVDYLYQRELEQAKQNSTI